MNRKIPIDFPLYDNVYGNDFPENQYFIVLFDAIPSKYATKDYYDISIIKYIVDTLGFTEECKIFSTLRNSDGLFESLFVNIQQQMMIHTKLSTGRGLTLLTLEILYNLKNGDLSTQISMSEIKKFQKNMVKSSIQLVKSDMGHLDTEEFDLFVPELNLEMNYGKKFIATHETIVKRLNNDRDKGIILLHGEPGSGKSTYLKYLTNQIKDKNVLFIPPSMAELLSEPSIIPFLMDNKNSILLIEDAERVIADREGKGSPAGVSNILNLTDGILGDCLNIQVIATFNMKRERIDPALLRKGRLIAEHKFEKLNIEDTNNLLKFLKKGVVSKVPLTLADIYNIDEEEVRVTKEAVKIGF